MTQLTEPDRAAVEQAVHEVVHGILPGLPPGSISGSKHLKDLGADSVDRVEIILSITARLGLDLPMSRFSELPDIDALVDYLCEVRRS